MVCSEDVLARRYPPTGARPGAALQSEHLLTLRKMQTLPLRFAEDGQRRPAGVELVVIGVINASSQIARKARFELTQFVRIKNYGSNVMIDEALCHLPAAFNSGYIIIDEQCPRLAELDIRF
jgi:hypothetical protein